ncbi:hypothetical protein Tcan_09817 [Toxocara canis]|uniref:Membrane protein BRI3 n=2 Tax=Toxocara canis TaxID=6265 RepID=A0A0B2VUM4_TOXCA|nr:hypothetical protein Tcan_09817 [Toxocara canis]VDM45355.1 unnamed protein product [Toxocara canis]
MTNKEESQSPSAPPAEGSTETSTSNPQPQPPGAVQSNGPYAPPYPVTSPVVAAPPPGTAVASPYSEPPPSYQAAMAYPAMPAPYPPGEGASFPKPNYGTPLPPNYNQLPPMSTQQFPPPPPTLVVSAPPPQARLAINVQTAAAGNCAYCRIGNVTGETDLCCLMCLIILAIFTFPFGLLFLCCIPCTVRRRCNNCRRIG